MNSCYEQGNVEIGTICVDSCYEVVSHGFGLPQLVGVAVVNHVITAGKQETNNKHDLQEQQSTYVDINPTEMDKHYNTQQRHKAHVSGAISNSLWSGSGVSKLQPAGQLRDTHQNYLLKLFALL